MSDLEVGFWSFPVLLCLILLRVPVGLAMFLVGLLGMFIVTGDLNLPLSRLKSETYTTFSNYSLSIIPMFLLMGHFATLGGMSQALFRAAEAWLGHRKGGVAMAAIGACAGFGAICGSSLATAATMGRVALPELRRYGYPGGLATATVAAGGTLGILIPPSVVLVIYAILTEQNIAKLFLAALVPGLLAALGYALAIALYVRVHSAAGPARDPLPYSLRLSLLVQVWPVLGIFALVVGGIYSGWFTPTEGAAVGALGTGVIAWWSGSLNRATLSESFVQTGQTTGMIFFIIFGAAFYNGFLALTQVPQELSSIVAAYGFGPYAVLLLILLFYLLLGCLMDSLSMILLTIPIFWPVVQGLEFEFVSMVELQTTRLEQMVGQGADIPPALLSEASGMLASGTELPRELVREIGLRGVTDGRLAAINSELTALWFGILVLIVVEVGLITPPVGMNLFVIGAMDRTTPLTETYRAVLWFVSTDILRVLLLIAVPALTLAFITW